MKLTSVSVDPSPSPVGPAMESSQLLHLEGNEGSATERSRSLDQLVVKGKAELVLRPVMLESIIGTVDSRVRILDTELPPWRMICQLEIESPMGTFIGTGWFAGPKTVVTAGHCIKAQQMGGAATRITVTPGRNDATKLFQSQRSTRFSATNLWISDENPDFDIGCIHLENAFAAQLGWFATEALSGEELKGYQVNVAGYPVDKGGSKLFHHANQVLATTDRRLFYNVDTMGGQSGGPVWIHKEADGPPIVVGIHAYSEYATPAALNIEANSAPRIIPETFQLIQEWVKSDTPQ